MEYKIGNIIFSKDTQYDKVLYWKLFRIFYALEHTTEELDYASCVTGEYGALLYRDVIDDKTTDDLYKKLLNETKLWGIEVNNIKQLMNIEVKDILKRYYDRIIKSIPQNILEKIQNIELFKLGYIEKNIYDELMTFKKDLKVWLENPKGTSVYYDIDGETPVLALDFHDQIFKIKKADSKLELIGDEYIVLNKCKTIITNHSNEEIINDYKSKKDYTFEVEGYTYYGVNAKNNNTKEFLLEMNDKEVSEIIIATDEEPTKIFGFDCKAFNDKKECIKIIETNMNMPCIDEKWEGLYDWLKDLSWINSTNLAIYLFNYDSAFNDNPFEKETFNILIDDTIKFWEKIDFSHVDYKSVKIFKINQKDMKYYNKLMEYLLKHNL